MSREYKELDGTVDNVGNRIVSDYKYHECCDMVGEKITGHLIDKLATPLMQSLGFTPTLLTQEVKQIDVKNVEAVYHVISDLNHIGVWSGTEFWGSHPGTDEAIDFLKNNKDKLVTTTFSERCDKERELKVLMPNRYISTALIRFTDINGFREALETNTPSKVTLGLKPSRFLSRYIEPLVPGITERYALAMSEKHTLKIQLTIDPNMMINCTESATFGSCYGHDGEYHYSAHKYATAPQTMMAVALDDNGNIMYRHWVFVNDTRTATINLKSYSSIRGNQIGMEAKKATDEFLLQTNDSKIHHDSPIGIRDPSGSTYVDCYTMTVKDGSYLAGCIDNSHEDIIWNNDHSRPTLGYAYDLNDGYETYNECPNNHYCQSCDERYSSDEITYVYSHGDICDYCLDEHFIMPEGRGDYYHQDDITENVHGTPYHEDDISDDHTQCYNNGEWYPDDEVTQPYDSKHYYAKEELVWCDETEEYYTTSDARDEALEELREREAEEA